MSQIKNKVSNKSKENIHGNEIPDQTLLNSSDVSPVPDGSSEFFDFAIDQQFIQENKTINLNLVKHRQYSRQKFAPFTRSQRRKRRNEVYKLHFEHGIPATRIAEMMRVNRNTINNDLKILYSQALNDYDPGNMSLDDILQKQLVRLETQRDRLCLYLCDAKDLTNKIPIERLIADIDFKLLGAIDKVRHNSSKFWNEITKKANKLAEVNKRDIRYTSLFELREISIDSRKSLNKLKEDVLRKNSK